MENYSVTTEGASPAIQKGPLPALRAPTLSNRFSRLLYLVKSDLCRYGAGTSRKAFCRHYIRTPGFRFMVWHRFRNAIEGLPLVRFGIQQAISWHLHTMGIRFGITLPMETAVGAGFYIGHFGGIVVHQEARIGRDCNISQHVTIGLASRGKRFGCPTIGDRVYLGPGCVIFGKITIGDDAAIGANAVVTHDVPAGAVVVGAPGRVVSQQGSAGYICNTGYGEPPAG